MTQRSPHINQMIREWAHNKHKYYCSTTGRLKKGVIDEWIQAHSQKPFVFASYETKDERKVIYILCTKCADIHKKFVMPDNKSGLKVLPVAPCFDLKYQTWEPYEYFDWNLKEKQFEKKVPR